MDYLIGFLSWNSNSIHQCSCNFANLYAYSKQTPKSLSPKTLYSKKSFHVLKRSKMLCWCVFVAHSVVPTLCDLHGLQHARLPCPSPSPGVCSNSYPLSLAIQPSYPVVPFSSCPQFFPASGSFLTSQLFSIRWPKYWSFSFSISSFKRGIY